jgi:hypothetical protein
MSDEADEEGMSSEEKKTKIVSDLATKVDGLNQRLKDAITNPKPKLSGDALLNKAIERAEDGYIISKEHDDTPD